MNKISHLTAHRLMEFVMGSDLCFATGGKHTSKALEKWKFIVLWLATDEIKASNLKVITLKINVM